MHADVAVKTAEARRCESQSHKFKGPCVSDSNCASVCRGEGFFGGDCRGVRHRCFCTRDCWINAQQASNESINQPQINSSNSW